MLVTSSRRGTSPMTFIGVAVATSLIALSGCAASGSETPTASAEPADLVMTVFTTNEDHLALFDSIAEEYLAANPDTVSSIEFEVIQPADYTTALTTRIAGGTAPDLAWVLEGSSREFVEGGVLADVSAALESTEGYEYDDLLESSLSLWRGSEDELFAYPFSNSPFVMFLNTDLITQAGQPNPVDLVESGDWTWDAAFEISGAVATATDAAGWVPLGFDYTNWQFLTAYWASLGASPWSADGTECGFQDPEMIEALTTLHEQIFEIGSIPGPGTTADFFAGDAAMTTSQISRAGLLDDSFGWDVVPLPAGDDGTQNVIGQAGIGVMADGPNVEAATDFLAYFTNPENARQLAAYFPPPRESLITAEVLAAANPKLTFEQVQVVVDGIPDAVTLPSHPRFAQLRDTVRAELDALWVPDADVETVAADVCSAIEPLLG